MNAKCAMTITLELFDKSFEASAHIELENEMKEFSFILNNDLLISSITSPDCGITFSKAETFEPMFRPLSQKIQVTSDSPMSELYIKYGGSVRYDEANKKNWHNEITEDFVSLNWYSVWVPDYLPADVSSDKVIVKNGRKWFVIKAEYDENNDVWTYGDQGYDGYNIVAFAKDKLQSVSSPHMDIFFVDDSIKDAAQSCVDIYDDIIRFYNEILFDKRDISKLDVVCAYPYIQTGGAYRRKDLMWCTAPDNDEFQRAYLFGHETAHIWCNGADCGSWEDWLNETTADWAALLFALHKNDTALFNSILKPKIELYNDLPAIKTADGSRPEGVHEKGTVLFYRVYQKYGYGCLTEIVRCFSRLERKNTQNLLDELRKLSEHGSDCLSGAAEMIEVGITEDIADKAFFR